MAVLPPKCIREKAYDYFNDKLTKEEEELFEKNLKSWLNVVKEVFR